MLASSQLGQSPVSSSQSSSGTPPKQRVQTIDIQWVFFFLSRIFPQSFFLDTVHGQKSSHILPSSQSGFFLFNHCNLPGYWLRPVIQPLAETTSLLIMISWGFPFFYHEPYQPQRINTVGVSFKTTPMGTIICKSTVHGLGLIP